ncbi:MAG: nucleotidyl transferase AbiEii/AbiGii toxin family protein [Candidatus Diapherotrites archaeon]
MAFGCKLVNEMISREELEKVSAARKTSLYFEEKEYLQYVFLHSVSRFAESFAFKGGTCLRICHGFERASEDLDFSSSLSIQKTRKIFERCLKDFALLNIEQEVFSEKEFEGNIRFEARFKGPLFSGNRHSTNSLKIDFNKGKSRNTVAKAIPKLFSDIPVFTIQALAEKEILAEKIRTLINRGQARDLYDVWMLLQNKTPIDTKLLEAKLKEENSSISKLKMPEKQAYERDLKPLLNFLPPYKQVKEEAEKELKKIRPLH